MGWRAITKDGEMLSEETHGRPVQAGEEGSLAVIAQEDYGHKVAIDLLNGIIALEYDDIRVQNGTVELDNPKYFMWICDDTLVAAEILPIEQIYHPFVDENGEVRLDENGNPAMVQSTFQHRLKWRPIWFSRVINGIPTKVIGAQTTIPKDITRTANIAKPKKSLSERGGKNIKKMIMLFPDGRVGIY